MGIGTLRRHHSAAEVEANAPAPAVPVSAPNDDAERLRADVNKLEGKLNRASEHVALWRQRALDLGYTDPEPQNAPEGGTEEPPGEHEQQTEHEADPIAAAREQDKPSKSAKTAEWVEYAERYPLDPPLDLTARPGLRDEIAAAYSAE